MTDVATRVLHFPVFIRGLNDLGNEGRPATQPFIDNYGASVSRPDAITAFVSGTFSRGNEQYRKPALPGDVGGLMLTYERFGLTTWFVLAKVEALPERDA